MARIVKFPINTPPFQNVDAMALQELGEQLYDGYITKIGDHLITTKRPGVSEQTALGNAKRIDGVYWWESLGILICVSDGRTYKVTDSSGTVADLTGDLLETSGRPSFADNGTTLVIANGGRMVTTDGSANTAYIADGDAPTTVTHVAFLDQWLLANKTGTGTFYYADFVGAPTTWLSTSVFTAESNPDNISSLYVNKRTIIIGGTESTEFWFNDGITPFSRQQGTTMSRGVMAPNSTVIVNEVIYFLDDKRRLVKIEGQTPVTTGTSFDTTIQGFSTVSDCIADYITYEGKNWVLFNFPTEDRTLFYDLDGDYWAEWSYWDSSANERKRFLGNCYAYARAWNQHLFGSFQVDKLLKMDSSVYEDDGNPIRFMKRTGWINHSFPSILKRSFMIVFSLKSGVGIGAGGNTEPKMKWKWRDNGDDTWGNYRQVGLKTSGSSNFRSEQVGLGSYYSRQHQIECGDAVPIVISDATEKIDGLPQ